VLIVRLLTASYHHTSPGGDESIFAECTSVYEGIADGRRFATAISFTLSPASRNHAAKDCWPMPV
jgi:hypothetical protein